MEKTKSKNIYLNNSNAGEQGTGYSYLIKWDKKIKYYISKLEKENDKIELELYIQSYIKKWYTKEVDNTYMLITRAYYNFLRDKCIKTEVIENQDGEQETRDIYANVSNHSFISDIENEANNKNYNDYSYDCSTSLIESIELERISALFNDNIKKLTPREQEVIIRAYRDNDYSNNHTQDIIKKLKRIMGVKA